MNEVEYKLRELIIKKYGSLKKFAETVSMPWTTLDSVLKRGINNSNISNVIKICNELNIDCESLYFGDIKPKHYQSFQTAAAHRDGEEDWSDEEKKKIEEYKQLLLLARKVKK